MAGSSFVLVLFDDRANQLHFATIAPRDCEVTSGYRERGRQVWNKNDLTADPDKLQRGPNEKPSNIRNEEEKAILKREPSARGPSDYLDPALVQHQDHRNPQQPICHKRRSAGGRQDHSRWELWHEPDFM